MVQPPFPGGMQPWLPELAHYAPLQTKGLPFKETSHVMEGAFVCLCGKAQPILPGKVNGWSFVRDGVSSISLTALRGGCFSATLTLKCKRQGRFTLLDDLRQQRDIKAHWVVHHLGVVIYLPDGASSVIDICTTFTSTQRFAQQRFC